MKILIVEDDVRMKQLLCDIIVGGGFDVVSTSDPVEAVHIIEDIDFDIVLTDLKMPKIDGLQFMEIVKNKNRDIPVILITAHGTVELAVEAIKKGAYDFVQKPFDPDELILTIKRASDLVDLIKENKLLQEKVKVAEQDDLLGENIKVREIKGIINKICNIDATVLIEGETGTGKELVAKLIHKKSYRKESNFLPINCGALSENLLEAELFGYEKGAFTGANFQKKGLFESVGEGTIFLDEINSTTESFQIKLLRVLQEKQIMRVGGIKPIDINARIIVASNKPLEEEVKKGNFRKDLFYRLNLIQIKIPPLRERKDDIQLLAHYFLRKFTTKYSKDIKNISVESIKKLNEYNWPGNVRELENVIERAVIMSDDKELVIDPQEFNSENDDAITTGLMTLEEMEKILIKKTLILKNGNKKEAAISLGIDAATLWRKMKKYSIEL